MPDVPPSQASTQVILTPYGRPASLALDEAIRRAKAGSTLAPVTVVVPSNFAGLAARRLLGSHQLRSASRDGGTAGIANVNFLTPFRFAELLAVGQLRGKRPLTNPVLSAAVRQVLAAEPREFARVRDHQATEQALAAAVGELSNVGRIGIDSILEAGGFAASVVGVHLDVQARLRDFHDEADVARAAMHRQDLADALVGFGPIVWFLPGATTAPLALFLKAVLEHATATVIVGRAGVDAADGEVDRALRIAGVDVAPVPTSAQEPDEPAGTLASQVVSVSDADDEVRLVVREVVGLVEAGVPLDRIGIFHPVPDPYVRLLEQHFRAAGIASNGPSRRRLAESIGGRVLLAALALPGERWRRDRVMGLVTSGPIRHGTGLARPTAWDTVSRDAGVVSGVRDWRAKLDAHAQRLAGFHEEAVREGMTPRADSVARTRADALDLRSFIDGLETALAAVGAAKGWTERSAAATELLHGLLGPAHQHGGWPEAEQVAFEAVESALERLAALDEVDPEPSLAVFTRALVAELSVARERSGRYGQGVLYGPLASAVGHDLDAVFILGCAEGLLPAPRREDALLSDRARNLTGGDLPPRLGQVHEQHRLFLAALASAPMDRRWLLFPRGDLRSSRRARPSRWLLPSASALAGKTVYATDFDDSTPSGVIEVPSHADAILNAEHPASLAERDLGEVLGFVQRHGVALDHPAAADVVAGLDLQRARTSASFTEFDGNLAHQALPTTDERPQTASRLETWAACGFRYFLAHVLGIGDRDDPERTFELSALDRGSAVHEILETFLRAVVQAGPPTPDQPWSAQHRADAQRVARAVFADYEERGRTGRPVLWGTQKSELLASIDEFLTADDAHRERFGATPARFEQGFGLGDEPRPVEIEIADGRRLRFRGLVDRIDTAPDGRMIVSDYKTGSGSQYKDLHKGDPTEGGTLLQLGLYAEAAHQLLGATTVDTRYWMVNARANYERFGYEWTDDHRARLTEVVDTIVRGVESGVFVATPGDWDSFRRTYEQCRFCEFDTLCPRDRAEHAAEKAHAPELEVRVALTSGPADEPTDT
ncbi:MAG: PD-(D/E)XK nuclease family protein [Actinomycetota bacterium]